MDKNIILPKFGTDEHIAKLAQKAAEKMDQEALSHFRPKDPPKITIIEETTELTPEMIEKLKHLKPMQGTNIRIGKAKKGGFFARESTI